MKSYKVLSFCFAFIFAAWSSVMASSIDYDELDLEFETARLCFLVKNIRPDGPRAYEYCKQIAQNIISERAGLVSSAYNICDQGFLERRVRCYSTLSKNYYVDFFPGPAIYHFSWETLENMIPQIIYSVDFDQLEDGRLKQHLQKQYDLISIWGLNAVDSAVLLCSQVSHLGSAKLERLCFSRAFEAIEG